MAKTKIEWADMVWNPVWGCRNGCAFCYARKIAKRFGRELAAAAPLPDEAVYEYGVKLETFEPVFMPWKLDVKIPKLTKRVFVNSMSDIMYWDNTWMNKVQGKICDHPNTDFIFLTKGGYDAYAGYDYPNNVVCGITVCRGKDMPPQKVGRFWPAKRWLLNIEPILTGFENGYAIQAAMEFDWIIIGALTNFPSSIQPKWEWYADVVKEAISRKIPVFIKPSLRDITPPQYYLQQYPER